MQENTILSRDAYNKMCECNHRELACLPIDYIADALMLSGWAMEDIVREHEDCEGVYYTYKVSQDEMIDILLRLKKTGMFKPIEHEEKPKREVNEEMRKIVKGLF